MELETKELLDLSHTLAGEYLAGFQYPWQALDGIKELILTLGAALPPEEPPGTYAGSHGFLVFLK